MTQPIEVSRVVRLPPARAFALFTEEIGRWWVRRPSPWGNAGDPLSLECHCGGEVREGGDVVGHVQQIEPAASIAFTLHGSVVSIHFEAIEGGTRVELKHHGWERWTADSSPQAFFDVMSVFWADSLSRL